jgi:hypothetical protein
MNKRELKLYCFSPAVMLGTFIVEIGLAIWTLWRYKLNEVGRLAVLLLIFLATFQLAEYNVCATGWIDSITASRIGYIAITTLPPLGIHLAYALAKSKKRPLLWPAYISGAAFAIFFLAIGHALNGHTCYGNYVIFQMVPYAAWLYGLYYYGWMLAGVWIATKLATVKTKAALYGLVIGYAAFIIPTTAANLIDPETIKGIPSIMCGFAVLFALTLVCWILPKGGIKK